MSDAYSGLSAKLDKMAAALNWSCSAPTRRDLMLALILALPVPLSMALTPVVRLTFTYHDVFIPLDAAWRTLQGQWPHSDFYTPIGLAYFWLHGAAAWLVGMDGRAVIWSNIVALPFVLTPVLVLAWRRLDRLPALALIMLLAVLVTAPTFIDSPSTVVVHLANYNRIGGGLSALVCLWALCPPRDARAAWDVAEALLMGVVLLILLYLKLTFFAVATALVGCVAGRFWRQAVLAAAPVVLGVLVLEAMHPGLMAGYLHDIARAGAANGTLFRKFCVVRAVVANAELGVVLAMLAAVAVWITPGQLRRVAGVIVVAGGCLLISSQNYGAFSPSLAVLALVLAQLVRMGTSGQHDIRAPGQHGTQASRPMLALASMFAVLLATVPFIATQAAGTAAHAALSRMGGVVVDEGRTTPLRNLTWHKAMFEPAHMPDEFTVEEAIKWQHVVPARTLAAILADGFDLLRREGLSQKRIANLNFSNPFPVALQAPPPRGVALWWDPDRTFVKGKATPEMLVGDAEVVMVPKLWIYYFVVEDLMSVAGDALRQGYVAHESRFWTAWVRRP